MKNRAYTTTAAACVVALALAAPSSGGQVKLEMAGGTVTLEARDATVREILAEWSRVGKTRVLNGESLNSEPLTLQLKGVPEREALEILLRSIAGFVAAPRAAGQLSASLFDRIVLMPAPRPAAAPAQAAAQPGRQQPPMFSRPQPPPPPDNAVDDQDEPLPNGQMPLPGQMSGAPQPGVATPMPYRNPQQGAGANPQGTAGNPYVNPNPATSGAATPGAPTATPSAQTPGVPTAPPPTPNPIK